MALYALLYEELEFKSPLPQSNELSTKKKEEEEEIDQQDNILPFFIYK